MKELFNLMQCFPESRLLPSGWLCLSKAGNVGFTVRANGMTRRDFICKILECCSRDCAKGMPYKPERRNSEWRDSLILGFNRYLGTQFGQAAFTVIYSCLGNGIHHDKTLKFVDSGFDINTLLEDEDCTCSNAEKKEETE